MIARPLLPGAPILAFPGWPVGYPSCLHKRVSLSHSGTLIRKSPAASARDCDNRAGKNRELLGGKEPGELQFPFRVRLILAAANHFFAVGYSFRIDGLFGGF